MDKLTWWKVHSTKRAHERYRISLSEEVRSEIIQNISRGEYEQKKRQGRRRIVYVLDYRGKFIKLVLNTRWKAIITFLELHKPPLPI